MTPSLTIIPAYSYLGAKKASLDVLFRIQAPEVSPTVVDRTPINFILAIDTSGSMSGKGISYARRAAQFFIEQLQPTDTVGIITFDSVAKVLVPVGPLTDRVATLAIIEKLGASGGTNLFDGLSLSYKELSALDGTRRVIVLTDGQPTVGKQGAPEILALTKQAQTQQIITSVFGLGNDFNEILMQQMAQSGDGNYYYIESPEQLSNIFEQEFKLASNVIGQSVSLDFSRLVNAKISTLYNLFKLDGTKITELPNLQSGRSFDVLCKLEFEHNGATDSFGFVDLVWFWEGETQRISAEISLAQVLVTDWELQPVEPEVQTRKSLLTVASNQVKIAEAIQAGNAAFANELFVQSEGLIGGMSTAESQMLKRSLSVAKQDMVAGDYSKLSKGLRYASYSSTRSFVPDEKDTV